MDEPLIQPLPAQDAPQASQEALDKLRDHLGRLPNLVHTLAHSPAALASFWGQLQATMGKLSLTFTEPMNRQSVAELKNYAIKVWDLKRTRNYGSKHLNERPWKVEEAMLSADGKTVTLSIPQLAPTWSMEIKYKLKSKPGDAVVGTIHNTIHAVGK